MDASEMGKLGAKLTNKILTTETRSKAAKKGWKDRRERLKSFTEKPVKGRK